MAVTLAFAMQPLSSDDQPTIPTAPRNGSRSSSPGWQAPEVEELQSMLPQYEVLEILGRGGMGAVYKARQKSLKRLVAIKILPLGMADDEMKFAERFRHEAETMAQMNHPAIVAVHDFGETQNGLLYIVMEFVDGTDVQKMIQASGKLPQDHALAITAHVCDALAYAHKLGVVHRDIKPANILIDREGHVKVADFGLAKMSDPSVTSGLTLSNMAMGTPDYVAPETLKHGAAVDHRADIYAVGVMLYQMLTGEVPRGMFKLPSQKGIGCDPRFDEIIHRALEQDREERYQSAMDVRRALDEIRTTPLAKSEGTGAISASAIPRSLHVAPTPQPTPASSAKARWLFAVGIVAVLGFGGWFMFGRKGTPSDSSAAVKAGANPADAAFFAQVAAAPARQQAELVGERIYALNKIRVNLTPKVEKEKMIELIVERVDEQSVPDLSPIAALRHLRALDIRTSDTRDLAWLRGMKLDNLKIGSITATDLKPIAELPLRYLDIRNAGERDYSVLAGLKLIAFVVHNSPVRDISFLRGMPVNRVDLRQTGLTDWSPLRGLPLHDVTGDFVPERDAKILSEIPTLALINGRPAAEFWASIRAKAAPAAASKGKVMDLLALVDVRRDKISGAWSRAGDELVLKPDPIASPGVSRLQLPYQSPEEYDFEFEFTPDTDARELSQVLSAYGRSFAWTINGTTSHGRKSGFEMIDGKMVIDRTDGSVEREQFLAAGKRHRSKVEVRKSGLKGFFDDQELVAWGSSPGSYERLGIRPNMVLRDALHLGIAANPSLGMTVHKLTVREITGTGKVDGGTAAATH